MHLLQFSDLASQRLRFERACHQLIGDVSDETRVILYTTYALEWYQDTNFMDNGGKYGSTEYYRDLFKYARLGVPNDSQPADPNLTFGPEICRALKNYGITDPIDVHLMVKPVDPLIGDFIDAGADYITFHPEASEHVDRSLALIKEAGVKAGLVFNPATPLDICQHVMDKLDMILK